MQTRGQAGPARAFAITFPRHPREKPTGVSLTLSQTKPYWACPEQLCEAIVDPATRERIAALGSALRRPAARRKRRKGRL